MYRSESTQYENYTKIYWHGVTAEYASYISRFEFSNYSWNKSALPDVWKWKLILVGGKGEFESKYLAKMNCLFSL